MIELEREGDSAMIDRRRMRRWMMVAVMAVAAIPAAAITPVDHPSQMLTHMEGKDLALSSRMGGDLMQMFFMPQSSNDLPCVPGGEIQVSAEMICSYEDSVTARPELLLAIVGKGDAARIASVTWHHPFSTPLWRCGKKGAWYVCFPNDTDPSADATGVHDWYRILDLVDDRPQTHR